MAKNKPPQQATADDPVELTNAEDPSHELSQVAALRTLADDRGARITALETERDKLLADIGAGPGLGKHPRIHVMSLDIITAPEHALLLKCSGEESDLLAFKRSLAGLLESVGPEPDGVDAATVANEVVEKAPRDHSHDDDPTPRDEPEDVSHR